jgi:hypothetical protein
MFFVRLKKEEKSKFGQRAGGDEGFCWVNWRILPKTAKKKECDLLQEGETSSITGEEKKKKCHKEEVWEEEESEKKERSLRMESIL